MRVDGGQLFLPTPKHASEVGPATGIDLQQYISPSVELIFFYLEGSKVSEISKCNLHIVKISVSVSVLVFVYFHSNYMFFFLRIGNDSRKGSKQLSHAEGRLGKFYVFV